MKANTILFFLSFFLFFVTGTFAQSALEKYDQETIYLSHGKYIKNGQKYPIGLFGNKLKKELEINPNAVLEFKKYERNLWSSVLLYSAGALSLLAANEVDSNNKGLKNGLYIGGIGMITATIPFAIKASKSYHKSIWLRNRGVFKIKK